MQLATRLAIMLGGLALAWGSLTNAVSNIARSTAPDIVLRFAPRDAGAMIWLANQQIEDLGNPEVQQRVETLASEGLQSEILNAKAFRLLGYVADARSDAPRAHRFIAIAQTLSRREIGTQYWLIQEAVARNDVAATLDHYDIALRTSAAAQSTLYPILTRALSDRRVHPAFVLLFRQDPPWMASFLSSAIQMGADPISIAELFRSAGGAPANPVYRSLEGALLSRLESQGEIAELRAFYESLSGGAHEEERSASFDHRGSNDPAPVSWRTFSSSDRSAAIEQAEDGIPALHIWGSGPFGIVARKMLFVEPGLYRLAGSINYAKRPDGGLVGAEIECLNGKVATALTRLDLLRNGPFTATVDIPGSCGAIYLQFGSDGGASSEVEGSVSGLKLERGDDRVRAH